MSAAKDLSCRARYFGVPRTVQNNAAIPSTNTTTSIRTDVVCNRSNSTRKGFSFGVASTEAISVRNSASRGVTRVCDTNVSANIKTTPIIAGCKNVFNEGASTKPAKR
jgi:hypothetical protein